MGRSDDAHGHNRFDGFFNGHLRRKDLFFREEKEVAGRRGKPRRDEDGDFFFILEIGQLIGDKPENEISFSRKFDKDRLPEGAFFRRGKGIGQLL